jgi:hypothetical protein
LGCVTRLLSDSCVYVVPRTSGTKPAKEKKGRSVLYFNVMQFFVYDLRLGFRGLHLGSDSAMKLWSTCLRYLGLQAERSVPRQAEGERLTSREYTPPVMIDFQSLRAFLASVSIIRPIESTNGLNGRSEGGCRRRFSLATELRCFSTSLAVLWAAESPSAAARGSVAVWESWEARETMVMSMSSLERPLEADPMILMSFLPCVPVGLGKGLELVSRVLFLVLQVQRIKCQLGEPRARNQHSND